MNKQLNKEEWYRRLADFKNSGLTQKAWCEQQQLKLTGLRYWLTRSKELMKAEQPQEWFQINVTETGEPTISSITICIGKYKIEIGERFNKSVFIEVIKTLNEIC